MSIQKFVDRIIKQEDKIKKEFLFKHPDSYKEIIEIVLKFIYNEEDNYYEIPDIKIIHEINDGDYQGHLLYLIPIQGYQPSSYYYCFVGYGSCSGCDTLQNIRDYSDKNPTEQQIDDYYKLCIDVVTGIKKISAYGED